MPATLNKPLHREVQPARQCAERGCKIWLTSANEDEVCAEHGGWSIQLSARQAKQDREDLLAELMEMAA
jgi:hypothetical protein